MGGGGSQLICVRKWPLLLKIVRFGCSLTAHFLPQFTAVGNPFFLVSTYPLYCMATLRTGGTRQGVIVDESFEYRLAANGYVRECCCCL